MGKNYKWAKDGLAWELSLPSIIDGGKSSDLPKQHIDKEREDNKSKKNRIRGS